jgi:hypothetical protein
MKSWLTIPAADTCEFSALPIEIRQEITHWQLELRIVDKAKPRVRAMEAAARSMNVSYGSVRDTYYELRKRKDWRFLINLSKAKITSASVPVEILEEFRRRCEMNQRNSKAVHREMIRQWKSGRLTHSPTGSALPWPKSLNGGRHPNGCSYDNLMRLCREKYRGFDLLAMREGLGRALSVHGHQVLTTRVGLWVGSHYLFDDLLRDMKTIWIARQQMVRIQELGVLDLYSAHRFMVHRRPKFEEELENGKMKKNSVKESEMRFLVANTFRNIGYSPRGTVCVVEGGTAAIRKALAEFLHQHSGGLITVRGPGASGKEQVIAGYRGRGGGNPRHKAHLESLHNLLHNEAGSMLAATGHDRNPPEWLFGVEAITQGVCKALATLPAKRAGLLMTGMGEYWQTLDALSYFDQIVASRTDHDIEGWIKCGHVLTEYRMDPERDSWIPQVELAAMTPAQRGMLIAAAKADSRYVQARKMAPREVFAEGMDQLIKFPDHVIALMFCDDALGEDLRVSKSLNSKRKFSIEDKYSDPEPMIFFGEIKTPSGEMVQLSETESYGVVLNPWDPTALWVYDRKGGFLGTSARQNRVNPLDEAGMKHALGERSHANSLLLIPLRERHANAAAELLQLQEHNAAVMAGHAITDQEKAHDRDLKAIAGELSHEEIAAAIGGQEYDHPGQEQFSHEEISNLFSSCPED